MIDLYVEYGFYKENLISITKKGMNGSKEIADMMSAYRKSPPTTINGSPVVQLLDYELNTGKNLQTGEAWTILLPQSNVLQFVLADGSKISARPSGTEPKIKFYFSVNAKLNSADEFDAMHEQLRNKIQRIISEINKY